MEFRDYYEILGVPFDATQEHIKSAHTNLAKFSHPNALRDKPELQAWANARWKDVEEAYNVLCDREKRAAYDREYRAWQASKAERAKQGQYRKPEEPRVGCTLCEGRGKILCLVCEGRGDATCPGCAGDRITVCPVCHGAGSLSQTEYRDFMADMERAAQREKEAKARQQAEADARRQAEAAQKEEQVRQRWRIIGGVTAAFLLLIFVRGLTSSSVAPSQTTTISNSRTGSAPVERTVEATVDSWVDALRNGNLREHMEHYGNMLDVYFTKENVSWGTVYKDKAQFLRTYPRAVDYRIRNLNVTIISPDFAYAVFDKSWDFRTANNRRFAGDERQRLKLRLVGGNWRIFSEQELQVYWVVYPASAIAPRAATPLPAIPHPPAASNPESVPVIPTPPATPLPTIPAPSD